MRGRGGGGEGGDNNVHTIIFQIGNELAPDKLCQRCQRVALSKNSETHIYHTPCKMGLQVGTKKKQSHFWAQFCLKKLARAYVILLKKTQDATKPVCGPKFERVSSWILNINSYFCTLTSVLRNWQPLKTEANLNNVPNLVFTSKKTQHVASLL